MLPYQDIVFSITTFLFVSMLDDWRKAIRHDPAGLHNLLAAVTVPIARFEVIGVLGGHNGPFAMTAQGVSWDNPMPTEADRKSTMVEHIRQVFPNANITFRTVDTIQQLPSHLIPRKTSLGFFDWI